MFSSDGVGAVCGHKFRDHGGALLTPRYPVPLGEVMETQRYLAENPLPDEVQEEANELERFQKCGGVSSNA